MAYPSRTIRNLQFTRKENYTIPWPGLGLANCNLVWGEIWLRFELYVDGAYAGLASTMNMNGLTPNHPNPEGDNGRWDSIKDENALDWLIPRFDGDFQQLLLDYDADPANAVHIRGQYIPGKWQCEFVYSPPQDRPAPGSSGNASTRSDFASITNVAELIKTSDQDPEKLIDGFTTTLAGVSIDQGVGVKFTPTLEILIRQPSMAK
jgi:hypothetical protein